MSWSLRLSLFEVVVILTMLGAVVGVLAWI